MALTASAIQGVPKNHRYLKLKLIKKIFNLYNLFLAISKLKPNFETFLDIHVISSLSL